MYKLSLAKRLIREAFKSCSLHIGHTEENEFYVADNGWIMWFDEDSMPREIKGELISLSGDLPAPGTAFKTLTDGNNQMELINTDILPDFYDSRIRDYNASRFYYAKGTVTGIVLWSHKSEEMLLIDSRALALIRAEEDEMISGPFRSGRFICWRGEGQAFCIRTWPRGEDDEETERYLKALETGWL